MTFSNDNPKGENDVWKNNKQTMQRIRVNVHIINICDQELKQLSESSIYLQYLDGACLSYFYHT